MNEESLCPRTIATFWWGTLLYIPFVQYNQHVQSKPLIDYHAYFASMLFGIVCSTSDTKPPLEFFDCHNFETLGNLPTRKTCDKVNKVLFM